MATVKAIHQTCTGKNDLFINTGNHHKMTLNQFVKKIESGNSVYSDRYYLNTIVVVKLQYQNQTAVKKTILNKLSLLSYTGTSFS